MEEVQSELPASSTISTLFSSNTELCADSVEWCPHVPHQNYFVCANYQLTSDSKFSGGKIVARKRHGRIFLYSIGNELRLHQTLETAAVLDQKWCHNQINDASVLGVVNAEKSVEIYKLNPVSELELITTFTITDDETETLILSLDWSTGKHASNEPEIVCSDSKGNAHHLRFADNTLELKKTWHAHSFEAWIAAFDYWDTNVLFTGGDDSLFSKFDLRTGTEPVATNRSHEAGVTSIHSNAAQEHVVATGSYDCFARVWDVRRIKTPVSAVKMAGPVWRLKWEPFTHRFLLAACMLGGLHVVGVGNDEMKVVESYYEHKNIVYGADWCFLPEKDVDKLKEEGNRVVASCSFYDRLLCVAKFRLSV